MKQHTTNYFDTVIEIAPDTKAISGTKPPSKPNKTVAEIQYEILADQPYQYTSDDVLFEVFAIRNDIPESEKPASRITFFSRGQACFRTSPLPKTYGFGIHSNREGKIALIPMESNLYQNLIDDTAVKKIKAMKSSR